MKTKRPALSTIRVLVLASGQTPSCRWECKGRKWKMFVPIRSLINGNTGCIYYQWFVQYMSSFGLTAMLESLCLLETNWIDSIIPLNRKTRTNKKKSGSFEASGENRGNFKLNFNRLQIDNLGPGYMLYYSRGLTAFSGRTSLASDSRNLYRCWLWFHFLKMIIIRATQVWTDGHLCTKMKKLRFKPTFSETLL